MKKKVRVRVFHANPSVHCAVKWPLKRNSNLFSKLRLKKKTECKLQRRIGLPFKEQHTADVLVRRTRRRSMMPSTGESWLASRLGPLKMAGGSITMVNLNQVPVEDVRKLLATHFQPNGCQSVKEVKRWASAQDLNMAAEDLRTFGESHEGIVRCRIERYGDRRCRSE